MIDSDLILKNLIKEGYTHLCVVPCSFATGLINACINNSEEISYIPCASEGIACSIANGLFLSGQKPIIIIQSSGLTNLGSCLTSLSLPYKIMFPIIVSWRTYKKGDSEIQHKHLAKYLPSLVNSYGYKLEYIGENLKDIIDKINSCFEKSKILYISKDTFSFTPLKDKYKNDLSGFPKRSEYLDELNEISKSNKFIKFIGTTGNTSREMHQYMINSENFYMAGNMGGALSLGLGVSLGGNTVIICGGDAEFTMHLGGLTTAGRYQNECKVIYIVFDNESNKSTGGQDSYQKHINYISIAKASNWNTISKIITNIEDFKKTISNLLKDLSGLNFIHVKCSFDELCSRPSAESIIESKLIFKKFN